MLHIITLSPEVLRNVYVQTLQTGISALWAGWKTDVIAGCVTWHVIAGCVTAGCDTLFYILVCLVCVRACVCVCVYVCVC